MRRFHYVCGEGHGCCQPIASTCELAHRDLPLGLQCWSMLARRMQGPLVAIVAESRRIVCVEVGWHKVMGWSLKESLLGQRLLQLEPIIWPTRTWWRWGHLIERVVVGLEYSRIMLF